MSRANLLRVELEQAALIPDLDKRAPALNDLRAAVKAVVLESYETQTVRPTSRLIRAGVLGMVILEQALVSESRGDVADETKALAWAARLGLKPIIDLYATDADESPGAAVRYGEACRLSGSISRARASWERSRDRLALYRGPESPVVKALQARLDTLH